MLDLIRQPPILELLVDVIKDFIAGAPLVRQRLSLLSVSLQADYPMRCPLVVFRGRKLLVARRFIQIH